MEELAPRLNQGATRRERESGGTAVSMLLSHMTLYVAP